MSEHTEISWSDATWNPTTGCTKVSPACAHCYIERTPPFRMKGRSFVNGHIPLEIHRNRLDTPSGWKKPKRIFVNSLSDLFHEDVPDTLILSVFTTMQRCPQHTFQILTKRPTRMRDIVGWVGRKFADEDEAFPLPNVWLGVSVENQHFADERIPLLLQTPAAVRFISAEPLLGNIRLRWNLVHDQGERLDWVIAGGESGPKARPSHPDWFRSLRDQCQAAGVAFHFKQWGEWAPIQYIDRQTHAPMINVSLAPNDPRLRLLNDPPVNVERFGKKAAGRVLDGRTWDEFPRVRA